MNKKILLLLVIICICINPLQAVELDADDLQELHELEDKMCLEMYGVHFNELKEQATGEWVTAQASIIYEQRISNVEQALQNYLMIHGGVVV